MRIKVHLAPPLSEEVERLIALLSSDLDPLVRKLAVVRAEQLIARYAR